MPLIELALFSVHFLDEAVFTTVPRRSYSENCIFTVGIPDCVHLFLPQVVYLAVSEEGVGVPDVPPSSVALCGALTLPSLSVLAVFLAESSHVISVAAPRVEMLFVLVLSLSDAHDHCPAT